MKNGITGSVLFVETHQFQSTDTLSCEISSALSTLESYKHPTCCQIMSRLPTNTNGKPDRKALRPQVPDILARYSA